MNYDSESLVVNYYDSVALRADVRAHSFPILRVISKKLRLPVRDAHKYPKSPTFSRSGGTPPGTPAGTPGDYNFHEEYMAAPIFRP